MNRSPTPDGVFVGVSWLNVYILRSVRWAFRGCWLGIHGMFATCSLSVRYIFAIQKYGFCRAKVWFLFFECYVVANR